MKLFSWFRTLTASIITREPPPGSTICASCLKPILQGQPVAHAWIGARHPFTHATYKCDESGGAMYGGTWGKGCLMKHPSLL